GCQPGSYTCDLQGRSLRCEGEGVWAIFDSCTRGCHEGQCVSPLCTPGHRRCGVEGVEICDASAQWIPGEPCITCEAGACLDHQDSWPEAAPEAIPGQADCGDLHLQYGEECDGVDAACQAINRLFAPEGIARCDTDCLFDLSDCQPLDVCGDGVLGAQEACDDGNQINHDGCSANCVLEDGQGEDATARLRGESRQVRDDFCDSPDGQARSARLDQINETITVRVKLHIVTSDEGSPAVLAPELKALIQEVNVFLQREANITLQPFKEVDWIEEGAWYNLTRARHGTLTNWKNADRALDIYAVHTYEGFCARADGQGDGSAGDSVVFVPACGAWALARGLARLLGLDAITAAARCPLPVDCQDCAAGCAVACEPPVDPRALTADYPCGRDLVLARLPEGGASQMRCHLRRTFPHASKKIRFQEGEVVRIGHSPALFIYRRGWLHHISSESIFGDLNLSFIGYTYFEDESFLDSDFLNGDLKRGFPIGGSQSPVIDSNDGKIYVKHHNEDIWIYLNSDNWHDDAFFDYFGNTKDAIFDKTTNEFIINRHFVTSTGFYPPGFNEALGVWQYCNRSGFFAPIWYENQGVVPSVPETEYTSQIRPESHAFIDRNEAENDIGCPYNDDGHGPFVHSFYGYWVQSFVQSDGNSNTLVYNADQAQAWIINGAIRALWRCITMYDPQILGAPREDPRSVDGVIYQRFEGGEIRRLANGKLSVEGPGLDAESEMLTRCARLGRDHEGVSDDAPSRLAPMPPPTPHSCEPGARICTPEGDAAQICQDGVWQSEVCHCGCIEGACARGFAELCNGEDDDCDGEVDEDIADMPCDLGCGAGVRRCVNGRWGGCSAGRPRAETPNFQDDDCDGLIDEDFRQSMYRYYNKCTSYMQWNSTSPCAPLSNQPTSGCYCDIESWAEPRCGIQSCWERLVVYRTYTHPVEGADMARIRLCRDGTGLRHRLVWDHEHCAMDELPGLPHDIGFLVRPDAASLPPEAAMPWPVYQCWVGHPPFHTLFLSTDPCECATGHSVPSGFVDPYTGQEVNSPIAFGYLFLDRHFDGDGRCLE
ncbi:hypothetical protein KKB55_14835, partial [Myxococcota bacterium]|nr:hypothetical protein [Myxococcota bacterium]